MSARSIRRTLLIRCGAGTGLLLCLLSAGVYLLVRQSLYRELDESIRQMASLLANQMELEDELITFEWQEGLGTNRDLIERGLFQFWDERSNLTTRSPGLQVRDLPRFQGIGGKPLMRNITLPDGHPGRAIGLRIFPFVLPEEAIAMRERNRVVDSKTLPHTLVVARDARPVETTLENLRWVLATGTLLTLGLGFAVIGRVVKVSLRPIDDLAAQMKDRAEHRLDVALEVPDELPSELTGLAENFDLLLGRVAAIRQRERDFVRHAAHELRTPIAGLRATTDLALSQPRDAAAYAAHLATCQKSAIELGELVKRLSALSRIGQTGDPPSRGQVDLSLILTGCLAQFSPSFDARGLTVKNELAGAPLLANGDSTLVRIILNNLLDNVASYASEGGEVRIQGGPNGSLVEIRIANPTNDPPDDPDRLFEPLFRRETSRNDASAHLGIGLTLSLEAATAMGTTLKARIIDAGWIEFTLAMPSA